MSWKEEQKLEGANTVSNNVDKDGDQIINEEQANRDQEQKEDKLPSKRARRLRATRHVDFFMAVRQHESINVQNTETIFIVFHQNIMGLLNKFEELICSLSPDFPQVLCLTEHHLKHFEIDFMYMDQYKLGTKFYMESHKCGGVSTFVHDTLQCTNINLDEFCKEQDTEACAVRIILSYLTICIISIDHQREIFYIP
jgi:hypothetical protein